MDINNKDFSSWQIRYKTREAQINRVRESAPVLR
jgi:hypothetical protein